MIPGTTSAGAAAASGRPSEVGGAALPGGTLSLSAALASAAGASSAPGHPISAQPLLPNQALAPQLLLPQLSPQLLLPLQAQRLPAAPPASSLHAAPSLFLASHQTQTAAAPVSAAGAPSPQSGLGFPTQGTAAFAAVASSLGAGGAACGRAPTRGAAASAGARLGLSPTIPQIHGAQQAAATPQLLTASSQTARFLPQPRLSPQGTQTAPVQAWRLFPPTNARRTGAVSGGLTATAEAFLSQTQGPALSAQPAHPTRAPSASSTSSSPIAAAAVAGPSAVDFTDVSNQQQTQTQTQTPGAEGGAGPEARTSNSLSATPPMQTPPGTAAAGGSSLEALSAAASSACAATPSAASGAGPRTQQHQQHQQHQQLPQGGTGGSGRQSRSAAAGVSRASSSRANGGGVSSRRSGGVGGGTRGSAASSRRQTASGGNAAAATSGGGRERENGGEGAGGRDAEQCDVEGEVAEPEETLTQPRRIPADAFRVPTVPEEDYFSKVPGCYYHFGKREWRVVYRDPQNECKRRQKTHSIKKYGFYAARSKAEDLRIELEKQYGWAQTVPPPKKCDTDITRYINFDRVDKDAAATPTAGGGGATSCGAEGENDEEGREGAAAGGPSNFSASTPTGARTSARRAAKQQRLLLLQEQDTQPPQQTQNAQTAAERHPHASVRHSSSRPKLEAEAAAGNAGAGDGSRGGTWALRDRGGVKADPSSTASTAADPAEPGHLQQQSLSAGAGDGAASAAAGVASRRKRRTPSAAASAKDLATTAGAAHPAVGVLGVDVVVAASRAEENPASATRSRRKAASAEKMGGGVFENGGVSLRASPATPLAAGGRRLRAQATQGGVAAGVESLFGETRGAARNSGAAEEKGMSSCADGAESLGEASLETPDAQLGTAAAEDAPSPLVVSERGGGFLFDNAPLGFLSGDAPLTPAWTLSQTPADAEDAASTAAAPAPCSAAQDDGDASSSSGNEIRSSVGGASAEKAFSTHASSRGAPAADAASACALGRSSPSALFCIPDLRLVMRCAAAARGPVGGGDDSRSLQVSSSLRKASSHGSPQGAAESRSLLRHGAVADSSTLCGLGAGRRRLRDRRGGDGRAGRKGGGMGGSPGVGTEQEGGGAAQEEGRAAAAALLMHSSSAVGASPFNSLLPAAAVSGAEQSGGRLCGGDGTEAQGIGAGEDGSSAGGVATNSPCSSQNRAEGSAVEADSTGDVGGGSVLLPSQSSLLALQDALCNFVDLNSFPATPKLSAAAPPAVLSLLFAQHTRPSSARDASPDGARGEAAGASGGGLENKKQKRRSEESLLFGGGPRRARSSGRRGSNSAEDEICKGLKALTGESAAGGGAKRSCISVLPPLPAALSPAAFFSPCTIALDRDPSPALSFSEELLGEGAVLNPQDRTALAAGNGEGAGGGEGAAAAVFVAGGGADRGLAVGFALSRSGDGFLVPPSSRETTAAAVGVASRAAGAGRQGPGRGPVSSAETSLGRHVRDSLPDAVADAAKNSHATSVATAAAAFLPGASEGERILIPPDSPLYFPRAEKAAVGAGGGSGAVVGGASSLESSSLCCASRVSRGGASAGGAESPPTQLGSAVIAEACLSPPCLFKVQPAEDAGGLLAPLTPSPWVPTLGLPSLLHQIAEEPMLSLGSLAWSTGKLQLHQNAERLAANADGDSLAAVASFSGEGGCLGADGEAGAALPPCREREAFRCSGDLLAVRYRRNDAENEEETRCGAGGGEADAATAATEGGCAGEDEEAGGSPLAGEEVSGRKANDGATCGEGVGASSTFLSRIRKHLLQSARSPAAGV